MSQVKRQPTLIEEALAGAISGFVATVPMTVTMLVMHHLLPRREQTKLEPKQVSDDMLRKVGAHHHFTGREREHFSVIAHFGYGAVCGMVYALIERLLPLPRGIRGAVYGFFVWAASYIGWLPAMRTLPPPPRRPMRRNLLMVVAHLVWGFALELTQVMLRGRPYTRLTGLR